MAEPREPVEVALVAALGAQRLGAVGVVRGHVREPVDLARDRGQRRCRGREAPRRLAQVRHRLARRAHERADLVLQHRGRRLGELAGGAVELVEIARERAQVVERRAEHGGEPRGVVERRGRLRERARQQARRRGGRSGPARRSPRARRWRPRRARSGRVSDWPTVVVSRLKLWISRARFSLRWATSELSSRQVLVDRPDRAEQLAEVLVAAVEALAGADQQQLQVRLRVGVERREDLVEVDVGRRVRNRDRVALVELARLGACPGRARRTCP